MNWVMIVALLAILTAFLVCIGVVPLNQYTASGPVMALGLAIVAGNAGKK